MREGPPKIFDSLVFRIIIPLSVIVLLTGLGLYTVILRSVSDFADTQIKDSILTASHDTHRISDDSMTDLVKEGLARDEKSVRVNKALALGQIENYMQENNFKGFVVEGKKEILSVGNLSPGFPEIIEKKIKEYSVSQIEHNRNIYYATHTHFEPWDWHILLVKDSTAYLVLQAKVADAYRITAVILLVSIILMLFVMNRYIWDPISKIITPLKKGEPPEYKGIYEFEFLSDNIRQKIDALQKETGMLNNIYHIAASRRGEEFFDGVAMAVGKIFGLYSYIGRVSADGENAHVVATYCKDEMEKGMNIPLNGTPCEDVLTKKYMAVIEKDAYKQFPKAEKLTAIKADSYIGTAIFNSKGDVIGIVSAFGKQRAFTESDIKVFQTIGQMLGAEFERLNYEKEKEEMKEQLFQAQKLEAIGTLAGGIAHDFNNMLQGILGYAAFLKMKVPADSPMYEPLSVIEHSAERAAELTRQLLGFARKGKYIVGSLSLNKVAENVIAIITRTFDKKIKIETAFDSGISTVEGDKNQFENVILNLCLNAKDAMPAGGTLYIETLNAEIKDEDKPYPYMKAGEYAVIKVTDTGTGMAEDVKKRIFEPFFTTKEVGKGTGMGLAMVYGIVKNHNGFITVDSAPGKGSAFTVYFPVKTLSST